MELNETLQDVTKPPPEHNDIAEIATVVIFNGKYDQNTLEPNDNKRTK